MEGTFSYVNDRRGRSFSAINFAGNYAMIPKCSSASILSIVFWMFVPQITEESVVINLNNNSYVISLIKTQTRIVIENGIYQNSGYEINKWVHIAASLDGVFDFYVNGDIKSSAYQTNPIFHDSNCSFGDSMNKGYTLYAYLDDVFFFNRFLNPDEISAIMNFYA